MKLKRPIKGSSIGILAPANSMDELSPRYVKVGLERLELLGFQTKISKHAFEKKSSLPISASKRISDFEDLLDDPEVSLIMAVYGGYNSIDLLEDFPYSSFQKHRKPFIGYSDITALLVAINKFTEIPTLHGPSFASFCEPNLHQFTFDTFCNVLWSDEDIRISDPMSAADDLWYLSNNYTRNYYSTRWQIYRQGIAVGQLTGGNASTLLALAGTRFMPDFNNRILFLEFNTGTDYRLIDRSFVQLRYMGVFEQIKGLIIGKHQKDDEEVMREIIKKNLRNASFPIIYSVNCSHIDPFMTLPIGSNVILDTAKPEITFPTITV